MLPSSRAQLDVTGKLCAATSETPDSMECVASAYPTRFLTMSDFTLKVSALTAATLAFLVSISPKGNTATTPVQLVTHHVVQLFGSGDDGPVQHDALKAGFRSKENVGVALPRRDRTNKIVSSLADGTHGDHNRSGLRVSSQNGR